MKVIIAGSRTIIDYHTVKEAIKNAPFICEMTEVVSGGAKGVDKLGEEFARSHGYEVKIFVADWYHLGNRAGFVRNQEMGDYADALIAVWDGKSKGTNHMIQYMKRLNKPVFIYYVED